MKLSKVQSAVKDLGVSRIVREHDTVFTAQCSDGSCIDWIEFVNSDEASCLTIHAKFGFHSYEPKTLKALKQHIENSVN